MSNRFLNSLLIRLDFNYFVNKTKDLKLIFVGFKSIIIVENYL